MRWRRSTRISWREPGAAAALVLVCTAGTYAPWAGHGLFFADDYGIVGHVSLLPPPPVWGWPFGWPHGAASWWWMKLQYMLWGASPWGYGILALLQHLLNVWLVWRIGRRYMDPWAAAWAAAWMGLAPPQHDAVLSLADQTKLLCTAGALGALSLALRPGRLGWGASAAIIALMTLSLFTYPLGMLFPLLLIAVDRQMGRTATSDRWRWAILAGVLGIWLALTASWVFGEGESHRLMVWGSSVWEAPRGAAKNLAAALARVWVPFSTEGPAAWELPTKVALAGGSLWLIGRGLLGGAGSRLAAWGALAALVPLLAKTALDRHHLYLVSGCLGLLAAGEASRSPFRRPMALLGAAALVLGAVTATAGGQAFQRAGAYVKGYLEAVARRYPSVAEGAILEVPRPQRYVGDVLIYRDADYLDHAIRLRLGLKDVTVVIRD